MIAQSKREQSISIVFIGNSITAGVGFSDPATEAPLLRPERGEKGVFYLHPSEAGAVVLGECWAKAISKII